MNKYFHKARCSRGGKMCLQHRLLNLSSDDSKDVFPGNTPGWFTVKLPQILKLCGEWDGALTEIVFKPIFESARPKSLYVCCDIVQPSYGSDSLMPILRKVAVPENFNNKLIVMFPENYYIRLSREEIQYINIYIKDENWEDVSFSSQTLDCTLQLKQVKDVKEPC